MIDMHVRALTQQEGFPCHPARLRRVAGVMECQRTFPPFAKSNTAFPVYPARYRRLSSEKTAYFEQAFHLQRDATTTDEHARQTFHERAAYHAENLKLPAGQMLLHEERARTS